LLRRTDLRAGLPTAVADILPRARLDLAAAVEAVRPVLDEVRNHGALAVREATERFDGVRLSALRVPASAVHAAVVALDPAVRAALAEATVRVRQVSAAQRPGTTNTVLGDGAEVTERWLPVRRVGLYVPGGLVAYPSSVVMNVVPAQVAGVESLAVASPPQPAHGGLPHPAVLAACGLLGVEEVYAVGGAQAVAMFAYGAGEECAPVDLITGPGNRYVTAAKRLVQGVTGVDAEAGPTEIAILADESADPSYVAADLIAQAEHDPLAACLLVTDSIDLADAVDVSLAVQVPVTRHRQRVETALGGQGATVLVGSLADGVAVVDAWAPEHQEVNTADAAEVAGRIRNAGAVFVGPYAPVSLGDYLAGSNHVLPTGGTARFSGGLSVQSFLRVQHVVSYRRRALAAVAPHIAALGGAEDLAAHVEAVQVRLR